MHMHAQVMSISYRRDDAEHRGQIAGCSSSSYGGGYTGKLTTHLPQYVAPQSSQCTHFRQLGSRRDGCGIGRMHHEHFSGGSFIFSHGSVSVTWITRSAAKAAGVG